MAKRKDFHDLLRFLISLIIVLVLHYFFISKYLLHPTLHVAISLAMFWIILGIIAQLPIRKK